VTLRAPVMGSLATPPTVLAVHYPKVTHE